MARSIRPEREIRLTAQAKLSGVVRADYLTENVPINIGDAAE